MLQEFGVAVIEGPAAAAPYSLGEGRGVVRTDSPGARRPVPTGRSAVPAAGPGRSHWRPPRRAPPRMAQHQLDLPVPVGTAAEGHSTGVAVSEVQLGLAAREMLLAARPRISWRPPAWDWCGFVNVDRMRVNVPAVRRGDLRCWVCRCVAPVGEPGAVPEQLQQVVASADE